MKLTLSEELMLLSLDDEKGCAVSCASMAIPSAVCGALLFELVDCGAAELEGKKLAMKSDSRTGDRVLDFCIQTIGHPKKTPTLKSLLEKLSSKWKSIEELLLTNLVQKGILEKVEHKFLWVIPYDRFPTKDAAPENEIRKRLTEIVLDKRVPEERDFILLSLVKASHLESEVFCKADRKICDKKIEEILKNDAFGSAVNAVVTEIQVALIVVVSTAAMVTTVT